MIAFYAGLAIGCSCGGLVVYQMFRERVEGLKLQIAVDRWMRELEQQNETECRFFRRSLN